MAPPASDMPLAAEDYELYMPLLEAMRLDLEETLEDRSNAVFYPGRSIVVNRFLATLRSILGEQGEISAQSVCSAIKSYHSALLSRAPSDK